MTGTTTYGGGGASEKGARRIGPFHYVRLWLPDLLGALVLLALTAWLFEGTGRDLAITRVFYEAGAVKPFSQHLQFPWKLIYTFVAVPVVALALGAFALLVLSYRKPALRRFRLYGLFVLFVLCVGPGLVVNIGLKNFWGRPRPRHVQEFGGRWAYRDALDRGPAGLGKSFPCGHSSAGYVFCVFYFLFRRRRARWAGLVLAALLGSLFGLGRVMAGAHFTSDVLWSGGLVFLAAWFLYYFVMDIPGREDGGYAMQTHDAARERRMLWRGGALVIAIALASLFATPYYRDIVYTVQMPAAGRPAARVELDLAQGNVELRLGGDRLRIKGLAEGFAFVRSRVTRTARAERDPVEPFVEWTLRKQGLFSELNVELEVQAPTEGIKLFRVRIGDGTLEVLDPPTALPARMVFRVDRGDIVLPAALRDNPAVQAEAPRGRVRYRDEDGGDF